MRYAVLVALLLAGAAQAAPVPADLAVMRARLAKAVAAHDRHAVAMFIAFPLALTVYQMPPKLTEAAFLKSDDYLSGLFDASLAACIGKDPLVAQKGGAWLADCNGNEYTFARRGTAWKLVGYENINE
jgi:hypothetical protein